MSQLLIIPTSTLSIHHPQNCAYQSIISLSDTKLTNLTSPKPIVLSRTNRQKEDDQLSIDFTPGPFDVICSQGKTAKSHEGNKRFVSTIQKRAKDYKNATEKRVKSMIVRSIIDEIRTKSPDGGFVKKDSDGQWRTVSLEQAREKVSQSLRDTLAGSYRSSLSAKKRSRMESNLKRMIDFEEIIGTNKFVSDRMQWLSKTIKTSNVSNSTSSISDSQILKRMTETNFCILRQLKQDRVVQQQVRNEHPKTTTEEHINKKALLSTYSAVDETLKKFQFDEEFMM